MGKVKHMGARSVKWSFFIYCPICFVLACTGVFVMGHGTNYLQDWYEEKYSDGPATFPDGGTYHIYGDEDGVLHYEFATGKPFQSDSTLHNWTYWIISNAQVLLMPLWVFACIAVMASIFYRRKLQKPINDLMDASAKISDNCLDFRLESSSQDEMGQLVRSFETMRRALYENNQRTWRMLEERKRLNAAFSHDMRTPVTVLKGYVDLLKKYIPDGRIPQEKLLDILEMMGGQISRLESYTDRMNMLHRLEDINPDPVRVPWAKLCGNCRECGDILTGKLHVDFEAVCQAEWIWVDEELVLEVYGNILSNAVRYVRERLCIRLVVDEDILEISVEDDGAGFSPEALQRAGSPFFHEQDGEDGKHFGLGLYICQILCGKCGGRLDIGNGDMGGRVKAVFRLGKNL